MNAIATTARSKPLRRGAPQRPSAVVGLAHVDGAVVISDYLVTWAHDQEKWLGRRLHLIPVPIVVDADECQPQPYPGGTPKVLFAGSAQCDKTIRFIFDGHDGRVGAVSRLSSHRHRDHSGGFGGSLAC